MGEGTVVFKRAAASQRLLRAFLRTFIYSTNQDSFPLYTSERCFILLNMQELRKSVVHHHHHHYHHRTEWCPQIRFIFSPETFVEGIDCYLECFFSLVMRDCVNSRSGLGILLEYFDIRVSAHKYLKKCV